MSAFLNNVRLFARAWTHDVVAFGGHVRALFVYWWVVYVCELLTAVLKSRPRWFHQCFGCLVFWADPNFVVALRDLTFPRERGCGGYANSSDCQKDRTCHS